MLQIVCDVCSRHVPEEGFILDLVQARLVYDTEGPPRVAERGRIDSLFICQQCRTAVDVSLDARRQKAQRPDTRAG
jgi:hypothetical protein